MSVNKSVIEFYYSRIIYLLGIIDFIFGLVLFNKVARLDAQETTRIFGPMMIHPWVDYFLVVILISIILPILLYYNRYDGATELAQAFNIQHESHIKITRFFVFFLFPLFGLAITTPLVLYGWWVEALSL